MMDDKTTGTPANHLAQDDTRVFTAATSRRRFLQGAAAAAAAATAATATAVAVAGAAHQSLPQAIRSFGPSTAGPSGCSLSSTMCFEAGNGSKRPLSAYEPISSFTVKHDHTGKVTGTTPPEFFLWFTAQDVPAGTYSINFSIPSDFSVVHDGEEPKGINVDLFLAPPCSTIACPTGEQLAQYEHHYQDLTALHHVVLGAITDVQVKLYLKFTAKKAPSNGTVYTFSGTLTGGSVSVGSSVSATAIV